MLVVDDDPAVRAVVERILEGNGCAVLSANGADAALEHLGGEGRIDLMVTDVVMPGLNGRMLAERAVELRPGLRVLFVSGYSTDGRLAALVEEGAAHFLAKPFSRAQLEAALRQLLDVQPGAAQSPGPH